MSHFPVQDPRFDPPASQAAPASSAMKTVLVVLGVGLRLRDPALVGLLLLVVVLQMTTSVVSSHMIGRASFRAGQVRHDLLVVDELSQALDHEEPRGAP